MEIRKLPNLCHQRTHGAVVADVTRHVTGANVHTSGRERTRTSTSSVITAETLEDRCKRLQEEWTTAEHQKIAIEYSMLGWTE